MEVGEWLYLKGNHNWRDSFLTSMIMGGSVVRLYHDVKWFTLESSTPQNSEPKSPLKKKITKGNEKLPTIHFQVRTVSLCQGNPKFFSQLEVCEW